ncbi:hypothetical protein SLH49_10740 [Cognatiyoonia sp. IB215446]|uniref:hypothetical protein n=1 Tax=Cognatiyoonia sp. IB215446 TaxID=3097355 RepID=UPI002A0CF8EB|nr:hypothetical protein [Cognatiyoonia sp. IB215446]MDX8348463.1 hypothetical protein [Cognatiyoonia sp. IB215446]
MMGKSVQLHIQRLAQAKLVTHIVKNADSVDPLFALSKVQDFPQVSFAAVFEDGSLVFGCQGELPPEIAQFAQPLATYEDPSQHAIPEKTNATTTALTQQYAETPTSNQTNRIAALQAAITRQAETSASILDRLTEFETRITAHQETIVACLPETTEQLSLIREHLKDDQSVTELRTAIAALQDQRSRDDAADLAVMRAKIEEISSRSLSDDQRSDKEEAYIARLSEMLAQMQVDLTTALCDLLPENETCSTQPQTQAILADMLASLPQADELNEKLAGLSREIIGLGENVVAASAHQYDPVADRLDHLAEQIAALAKRPDPTLNLTEQRQMMARFQTAMGQVMTRLEAEIARIETIGHAEEQSETAVAKLDSSMQTLTAQFESMNAMPSQLADIATYIEKLPEHQNTIVAALKSLKDRPAPVNDLTEQRKSLAQFAVAIGTAIKRLEVVTKQIGSNDTGQDLNESMRRIESLVHNHFAEDTKHDDGHAIASLRDAVGTLQSNISTLLDRPPPVPDMSLQRASLARFATAMSTILARLEKVADQIDPSTKKPLASQEEPDTTPDQLDVPALISPFANTEVSFDTLLFSFGEFIAQQIMKKSQKDGANLHVARQKNS